MNPTQNAPTTAVVEPTPADLLRGAALYLQRHGWTQGSYYIDAGVPSRLRTTATPAACVVGALAMAAYGRCTSDPFAVERPERRQFAGAVEFLTCQLYDEYGDEDGDNVVVIWNDRDSRTAADVIGTLNDAADEWDRTHRDGGEH